MSRNALYKRTGDEICMPLTDKPVRHMAYRLRRMFFIQCVSDWYTFRHGPKQGGENVFRSQKPEKNLWHEDGCR